jgi:hypothetical protein
LEDKTRQDTLSLRVLVPSTLSLSRLVLPVCLSSIVFSAEKEEHEDWGISERIVDLQSFDDVGEMKDPKIKVHGEY